MEVSVASAAFSALGHQPRLAVLCLLIERGPGGVSAGEIARLTESRPNTLSTHLNILAAAGLITARRDGRSIFYAASFDRISELVQFLVKNCCDGDVEACGPVIAKASRGG
jgi:DNA-binding transcriptional ArsR family regulator